MGYKMMCKADSREIGIEKEDGSWDFEKFKEHIKGCEVCNEAVDLLLKHMMDTISGKVKIKMR